MGWGLNNAMHSVCKSSHCTLYVILCRDTLFFEDFSLSSFISKFLSSPAQKEEGALVSCYQCKDEGTFISCCFFSS